MKYLLSAAALSAAAAVIGIASANQAHQPQQPQQQPSAAEIEAERAQVRRNLAAAQACGGSAWTLENNVLTCYKEIEQ